MVKRMKFVVCSLLVASAGCFDIGEGKGSLKGSLFIRECTTTADIGSFATPALYDMKPTFFVADPIDDFPKTMPMNKLGIRVQPTGNRFEEADALYVNVASVRDIALVLGQAITVGPATNIRAALDMNATCPDRAVQAELDGTINFTAFGGAESGLTPGYDFRVAFGDRLTASFVFDVIDRRVTTLGDTGDLNDTPSVAGHLEGTFDFVVRQGRSAQVL